MDKDKVLGLAKLARIEINEEEALKLSNEFEAILGYVSEVKSIQTDENEFNHEDFVLKNVMREDADAHESRIYTESLLSQAPSREGNYFRVKKIL